MSDCAARPRWAAHRRVLSRPDSRAIEAPCVLALHSPIPPARRASFRFDLLARGERDEDARPPLVIAVGGVAAVLVICAALEQRDPAHEQEKKRDEDRT